MMNPVLQDRTFMSHFYDLSSNTQDVRLTEAENILNHVQVSHQNNQVSSYTEYTVTRLIRGLGSSRESARIGFASCLCELLKDESISIKSVLESIETKLKITGSMKGGEERDLMFGQLFGYLSILKSGRIQSDSEVCNQLFEKLFELHQKKGWIREVVSESFLEFFWAVNSPLLLPLIPRLAPLLQTPLTEFSSWQILLALGLHAFSSSCDLSLRSSLLSMLPSLPTDLEPFTPTLLASSAGFPKVHRVWHYILGKIFGLGLDRELPSSRPSSLSPDQQASLQALSGVMDRLMCPSSASSHEKRGLGLKLASELIRLTPPDLLPFSVSLRFVRLLLSACSNSAHTLHRLALNTSKSLPSLASDSEEARLALCSCLVNHGGNFDAKSGSTTVHSLLSGLPSSAALAHLSLLVGLLSSQPEEEDEAQEGGRRRKDEDEGEGDELSALSLSSLDSLVSLARSSSLRPHVLPSVLTILTRLALFGPGPLPPSLLSPSPLSSDISGKKASKKSKKGKEEEKIGGKEDLSKMLCGKVWVGAAEWRLGSEAGSALSLAPGLAQAAATRLLALLGEVGGSSLVEEKAEQEGNGEKEKEGDKPSPSFSSPSPILLVLDLIQTMKGAGLKLREGEEEEGGDYSSALSRSHSLLMTLSDKEKGAEGGDAKFAGSLGSLLSSSILFCLLSPEPQTQLVSDLTQVCSDLLDPPSEETAESEEENESAQIRLLSISLDLLAAPASLSIRLVKDKLRKVWLALGQRGSGVEEGVLDELMDCILADDHEEEEEEGGEEEEEGSDEEDGEEEGEQEEQAKRQRDGQDQSEGKKKKKKGSVKAQESEEEQEEDEEEEEEEVISPDQAFDLLALDLEEEDAEEDEEGAIDKRIERVRAARGLEHDESADSALAALLQMKKQQRKAALVEAKKTQFLLRTRALDLLEAVLSRNESASLLSLLRPLLLVLKKQQTSSLSTSLAEGRAFESRLRSFLDQKLSKKKLSLPSVLPVVATPEDSEESLYAECAALCASLPALLNSPQPPVRETSLQCLLCALRPALSPLGSGLKGYFTSLVQRMYTLYSSKRCHISPRLFDELSTRFPDFFLSSLLPQLLEASSTGRTPFIQSDSLRLVSTLLKRCNGMSSESKDCLVQSVHSLLSCISLLATSSTQHKTLSSAAQLSRDLSSFLKTHPASRDSLLPLQTLRSALSSRLGEASLTDQTKKHLQQMEKALEPISIPEPEPETSAISKGKLNKPKKLKKADK